MQPRAILFGSRGSIADVKDIEREAFNAAFAEVGAGWVWTEPLFDALAATSDSANFIADYARLRGDNVDVVTLNWLKDEIFKQMLSRHPLRLRPGVRDVVRAAKASGLLIGIASTESASANTTFLRSIAHSVSPCSFSFIGDDSSVWQGKPMPGIYQKALEVLGVRPDHAIAIEDTPAGLAAATRARIPSVAFLTSEAHAVGLPNFTRRLDPRSIGISVSPAARMARGERPRTSFRAAAIAAE
ncbi:HAD family hydrolase [Oricola cellulosilytica]|uniref:HAD family hydrolase n=1 Tax=Oricola cellulosilytica TaxID=1429082 RepID=A0A4R0PE89_9HYPH|nr:HAD-IA family hydrolase [Oricola cellulosilytica]TCD15073.1 HAD family hydrolase [Oricola cellulosilytica]